MFAALDANKDGLLDMHELAAGRTSRRTRSPGPPRRAPNEGVFLLPDASGSRGRWPRPPTFRASGRRWVKLKAEQLEVLRVESDAGTLTPTQRTTLEHSRRSTRNNDGVLDSKEIFQPRSHSCPT